MVCLHNKGLSSSLAELRTKHYQLIAIMPQMASSLVPSFGYGSTARRVLSISELLQTIFSFGTRASNASNALVCRAWCEPALNHVWREVDDLYYLLRLLAPLHQQGESKYYVRRPT